ncbi:MAG: EAL domain-containing response regulator [Gammaproteobacteria bacterium]|nr:EAL domain-containing response regulator [Gammaproteobacteria bacterium]
MDKNILSKKTALVVDDEEFMRDFLSTVIKQVGIENVLTATGGQQALDIILSRSEPFDYVFCDLQMPEMDGIEVIRHLAAIDYSSGIVLFSGENQRILETAHSIAEARGLNLLGSLTKPVSVESLYQMLVNYQVAEKKSLWSSPEVSAEELQAALLAGDITVYYQPQVNIESMEVKGVEALARWNHAEKGMVPPDIFIDLAEQHQLIDAVTETVIKQTCQQGAIWSSQGRKFKLSINLSMDNLHSLDFPDRLMALVKSTGMDIKNLIFEITESVLVKDFNTCMDILTRLRLKGPELSIDDFGTGYASMDHLKRMPFSELKIDRAFVTGAHSNGTARAILESSIYLAKHLQMTTVAEGVENKQDLDLVASLGCDLVQGYYIARPMDAAAFDSWFEQR